MKRKRRAAPGSPACLARWLRRGVLAAALLGVAFIQTPGAASGPQSPGCANCRRQVTNAVRWTQPLTGQWSAAAGVSGTVPDSGQAYAGVGGGVAAVGAGLTVSAFSSAHGTPLWRDTLTGFPSAASIVSVRAWQGVVTVGVSVSAARRTEVVLGAATGAVLGRYPAAPFGGAVAGSQASTVVVGVRAVTSYDNSTGRARWSVPTGGAQQSWRLDGDVLYVEEQAGGGPGPASVTGLRRIDLSSGSERVVAPARDKPFAGALAGASDGVVLFSDAGGVTGYDGSNGRRLWFIPGAVPEGDDPVAGDLYLTQGSSLIRVVPRTGRITATVSGSTAGGSAGMYVVRDGVALGLDQGPEGQAWGFDVAAGRVIWTSQNLPWPHYFADLSGVGGSAEAAGNLVIIAACAQLGPAPSPGESGSGPSPSPATSATRSVSATGSATATLAPLDTPTPSATSPGTSCAGPELVALSL